MARGRIEAAEQSDALAFANARWLYGTLTLTKQVSGTQGRRGQGVRLHRDA